MIHCTPLHLHTWLRLSLFLFACLLVCLIERSTTQQQLNDNSITTTATTTTTTTTADHVNVVISHTLSVVRVYIPFVRSFVRSFIHSYIVYDGYIKTHLYSIQSINQSANQSINFHHHCVHTSLPALLCFLSLSLVFTLLFFSVSYLSRCFFFCSVLFQLTI